MSRFNIGYQSHPKAYHHHQQDPLPAKHQVTRGSPWGNLEKLTLCYGVESKWDYELIAQAIARVFENGTIFRNDNACRVYYYKYYASSPADVEKLFKEGGLLLWKIEIYLKGLGVEQFQSGICVDPQWVKVQKNVNADFHNVIGYDFTLEGARKALLEDVGKP